MTSYIILSHLRLKNHSTINKCFGQKVQTHEEENNMSIFLSQQFTIEELIHKVGIFEVLTSSKPTPYWSGYPVDKMLSDDIDLPMSIKLKLEDDYRSFVCSLN